MDQVVNNQAGSVVGPIRPALWGLAIALVTGLFVLGPEIIIPYTGQFSYLLSAISLGVLYLTWRAIGGPWFWLLPIPLAIIVGWDGYFATWTRLAAIGLHALLGFVLFNVMLRFWWRWIGERLKIGRFVLAAILFTIAGFVATWINGLYVDIQSTTAALIQLEMVGRNVLLGASFTLGLEIGEWARKR